MRTGGTLKQLHVKLNDIINSKRSLTDNNGELNITVEDLDAYALNEEGLSAALSNAVSTKELHVLHRTAIEDLCCEGLSKELAVIARIRLNDIPSSKPPSDAKKVGDFSYTYDTTFGAQIYYKRRLIRFGPVADKLVTFLLENEGTWKDKYKIAEGSGGTTEGVSQMVRDVNSKVPRLTSGEIKTLVERDGQGKYRINI